MRCTESIWLRLLRRFFIPATWFLRRQFLQHDTQSAVPLRVHAISYNRDSTFSAHVLPICRGRWCQGPSLGSRVDSPAPTAVLSEISFRARVIYAKVLVFSPRIPWFPRGRLSFRIIIFIALFGSRNFGRNVYKEGNWIAKGNNFGNWLNVRVTFGRVSNMLINFLLDSFVSPGVKGNANFFS